MVYNKELCKQVINGFAPYEADMIKALCSKRGTSALATLNDIFQRNPQFMYTLACEVYKYFVSKGICTPEQWEGRYNLLASYGYCFNSLFFAYSLKNDSLELYTSAIDILVSLAKSGKLRGKVDINNDLQKFNNYFSDNKLKKSVKDGLLRAVRLNVQALGTSAYLVGTCPRSALNLDDYIIIPFQSLVTGMKLLSEKLVNSILKVTQGDKVRYITRNVGVLAKVYGEKRAKELLSSSCIDVYSNRFYIPSIGASKYSYGLTNIKLTDVDSIEVLNSLQGIDLSEVNVDYSMVKEYFIDRVSKMSDGEIKSLQKYFDTGLDNISVNVLRNIIRSTDKYPRDLYSIMKENPTLFNMDKFSSIKSKFGDKCETVDIPKSMKELKELLKTGVFRIVRTTKKGTMSSVVCTLSTKELIRIYGYEKWIRFEPLKYRMEMLYKKVSDFDCDIITLDMFKMMNKIFHPNFYINADISKAKFLSLINQYMMYIDDNDKKASNSNLLLVRGCEAEYDEENECGYNYFYSIDFRTIMSLTRLN